MEDECVDGNKLEEVNTVKYLKVWFDRRLRGTVQLAKIIEKAEEYVGRVEWMGRESRMVEAERERENDVGADG